MTAVIDRDADSLHTYQISYESSYVRPIYLHWMMLRHTSKFSSLAANIAKDIGD